MDPSEYSDKMIIVRWYRQLKFVNRQTEATKVYRAKHTL